ncbi:MAG: nickel pincer cofactor biosynthesis protein LarC [Myxococcales bacterium]
MHDHPHHHDHPHDHPQPCAPLHAGAAVGSVLFFDAPSGLAGDMIVAALVDLGVPESVVSESVMALGLDGFHFHFGARVDSGIRATSFEVHVDVPQPPRSYAAVRTLLAEAPLAAPVRARAERVFLRLAAAEAKVHGVALDDVHFHEVGSVDALVDIVGACAAMAYLDPASVYVSPLPMGRGFVRAAHGRLPLPAPATVECLAGFETVDGGMDFEFVTPTGAALVGALAQGSRRWPSMRPSRSGWGAGSADLEDRPNLLRAVLGESEESEFACPRASHAVVEANLDDATGELVGHAMEALLTAGAVDVWATPSTMKKGRPGLTLSALALLAHADTVAAVFLRETPSIGVRRYEVTRVERPRRMVTVETPYGAIAVKVSEGPFGPPQEKPEFDACVEAARRHGVPVREVLRAVLAAGTSRTMAPPR